MIAVFEKLRPPNGPRVDSLPSRHGVVTDGKAFEFSVHFGWGALIYTHSVKVAFKTPDGRNIETWLPHDGPR